MISGTCDAIFVKNCLEFLLQVQIEHHQFTDNSAARQLISKQGVGRIRHLSAKLLWLQDLVRLGEIQVSQVPTFWNFSDVGTKNLSKSRLNLSFAALVQLIQLQQNPSARRSIMLLQNKMKIERL